MRKDGKRLKNIDPMYSIVPYIMVNRSDSMNGITLDIPIEPMEKYIREKRKSGVYISHLAIVTAAYLRTIAEYPLLNRFIVNKKIYARTEFAIGMVVLKAGSIDKGETISKIYLNETDTLTEVSNKINSYVEKNRQDDSNNKTDKIIKTLCNMTLLMRFVVGFLKWLDKIGLLPKSIIDASPFHCSMVITNLGSIRTNHIYHHIYDFGTVGQIVSLGMPREVPKRKGKEIVFERCLPLGVVMDERICAGVYYATAFKRFEEYLANPALLDEEPRVINKEF